MKPLIFSQSLRGTVDSQRTGDLCLKEEQSCGTECFNLRDPRLPTDSKCQNS